MKYTYSPSREAIEKRRAAAMDILTVVGISGALTVLALAYFDVLTF